MTPKRSNLTPVHRGSEFGSTQASSLIKQMTSYMPALTPVIARPSRHRNYTSRLTFNDVKDVDLSARGDDPERGADLPSSIVPPLALDAAQLSARNKQGDNQDLQGIVARTSNPPEIQIGPNGATVTLSGDHISPASPEKSHLSSTILAVSQAPLRVAPSGVVTAGKGKEMLNILVNDSFSTNHSKKTGSKKGGKKTFNKKRQSS